MPKFNTLENVHLKCTNGHSPFHISNTLLLRQVPLTDMDNIILQRNCKDGRKELHKNVRGHVFWILKKNFKNVFSNTGTDSVLEVEGVMYNAY